jgi:hypothetical protein
VKARTTVFTLTLCFVGAFCWAQNANMGTWKLNEAKSKISHGAPKNTMVVYEAAGENVRIVIDGIGSDNKPMHSEWTGKFDSKDYPVLGDPNSDARSLTKIDDRTLGFNAKKSGKTILSGPLSSLQTARAGQSLRVERIRTAKRSAVSPCTTSNR